MAIFDEYKPLYLAFDYPGKIDGFMDDLSVRFADLESAKYTATIGGTIIDLTTRLTIIEGDYADAAQGYADLDSRLDIIQADILSIQTGTGINDSVIAESKLLISNNPQPDYILSYNDILGLTWINASAVGGGVSGPDTSTDTCIARFDSSDGTSITDSNVFIDSNNCLFGQGVKLTTTNTTITLTTFHAGKVLTITGVGNKTIYMPAASTMPEGFHCVLLNRGTGVVSIVKQVGGDTLEAKGSTMDGQYSAATVLRLDTTTWAAYGDIV